MLKKLWEAYQNDGVDFLHEIGSRWGELCKVDEIANKWADDLKPLLEKTWSKESRGIGYTRSETPCLSCLLASKRYVEVFSLIDKAPFIWWHYRQYGVEALLKMGKTQEALEYAKKSAGTNDAPSIIDEMCEKILIESGQIEQAYKEYGLTANRANTNLATFNKIYKKYSHKSKKSILLRLIAA